MSQWTNLDQIAAASAQAIVEGQEKKKDDLENLITKALGVLQENGVYAMTLYLLSRSEKDQELACQVILKQLLLLFIHAKLAALGLAEAVKTLKPESISQKNSEAILKFFSDKVCDDLDRLLFVKSLYEQILIYARYGAKALEKPPENKNEEEKKRA